MSDKTLALGVLTGVVVSGGFISNVIFDELSGAAPSRTKLGQFRILGSIAGVVALGGLLVGGKKEGTFGRGVMYGAPLCSTILIGAITSDTLRKGGGFSSFNGEHSRLKAAASKL